MQKAKSGHIATTGFQVHHREWLVNVGKWLRLRKDIEGIEDRLDQAFICAMSGKPGRPLRVLVVDDRSDGADALAGLLRLDGHDAEAAYGGPQALESAHRRRPDVVLLDLAMPGMDGFEVARHLRSDFPDHPPMHIVALTGRGQKTDREQILAASFDGHLAKPADNVELQAILLTARQLLT